METSHVSPAAILRGIAVTTRNGCTNASGETVRAASRIVAVTLTIGPVPRIHMYTATMFQAAGKPMKKWSSDFRARLQ